MQPVHRCMWTNHGSALPPVTLLLVDLRPYFLQVKTNSSVSVRRGVMGYLTWHRFARVGMSKISMRHVKYSCTIKTSRNRRKLLYSSSIREWLLVSYRSRVSCTLSPRLYKGGQRSLQNIRHHTQSSGNTNHPLLGRRVLHYSRTKPVYTLCCLHHRLISAAPCLQFTILE